MTDLARALWGIPVILQAERDSVFPTPERDQRYQDRTTGTIYRYTGTTWVADHVAGYSVLQFGAVADATVAGVGTDNTSAFQAAITAAYAAGVATVYVPDGRYSIAGTLTTSPGVTLMGTARTGEYENAIPVGMASGATLIKPSTGTSGPILELGYGAAAHGIAFKHLKSGGATTGVVRVGPVGLTEDVVYASLAGCHIIGLRTSAIDGSTTCYGLYFPESQTGHARYYNKGSDLTITECDVGVRLSGQSNANTFTNLTIRECHVHIELDGGSSSAIENSFAGMSLFCQTVLSPAPIVFRLKNNADRNTFVGYCTEAIGKEFDVDATCDNNIFLGNTNEAAASHSNGQANLRYARPTNVAKYDEGYFLSQASTATDRLVQGLGATIRCREVIQGTLPQINRPAGTLAAGDASCKRIVSLGSLFTKATNISFAARLRVYAYSPSNRGMHVVDVDFTYRNVNQSTTAGQLCVTRVSNLGNVSPEVTGLWFIKSTTTPGPFAIALVGGNNSTTPFASIAVDLEMDALTYSTNLIDMSALHSGMSFTTADVTANDVTDAISLLTVANTTV